MKALIISVIVVGVTAGATALSTLATVTAYESSGFVAACFATFAVQVGLVIVGRLLGGGK